MARRIRFKISGKRAKVNSAILDSKSRLLEVGGKFLYKHNSFQRFLPVTVFVDSPLKAGDPPSQNLRQVYALTLV
jgi:hypothetical protein